MSRWATATERFWAKVNKDGPIPDHRPDLGPCWLWLGQTSTDGYGRFWIGYRASQAHRFSYQEINGPIPPGLVSGHLCRVRRCVNPAHLEAVEPRENLRRGLKGILTTHCPHGHPYDDENTIIRRGWRECRTCVRERTIRRRSRAA